MNPRLHSRLSPALLRFGLPIVILMAVLLIAACSSDKPETPPTFTPIPVLTLRIELGEVVSLSPGQSAEISGENVELAFHRVADDSRCAEGVQCETAGSTIVVMSLAGPDFESGQIEFIIQPGGGGQVQTGPYNVELVSIAPDPPPEGGVAASDYLVTFNVTKI
jgi:hypothetical protein|tara:strand:+ start:205 stop:696 length:492 start_codon:yes stop_codon:yes gene_type:complete